MTRRGFGAFVVGMSFGASRRRAHAGPAAWKLKDVTLYQPESVLASRVSVEALAPFLKAVQAAFEKTTGGAWAPSAEGAIVAIAVKPGRRQRAWCELVGPHRPGEVAAVEKACAAVAAPPVTGLVGVALNYVREGRDPKLPTIPKAWQAVAKKLGKPMLIPDDPVAVLWPE